MQEPHSFVDRIHYDGHREYTKMQGNIAYLDGTPLTRPADMPRAQRVIAFAIIAVAIIIGIVLVNTFVISRWQQEAATEQAVAANIARQPSIDTIPNMAGLIKLDNDAIKAKFSEAGYSIYDRSEKDDSNDLSLYKIPSDTSLGEVAGLYAAGINSLNAEEASKLLVGSWSFAVDRKNGTSMVVHYADFSTSDPQIAVQNAIRKEGFDQASVTDQGVDESGNTYTAGTLDVEGTNCAWKVSALPLDEMYSISGLPSNACYVGVRVTAL